MRGQSLSKESPGHIGSGLSIARTHDMGTVRAILAHPSIWPHIHDDAATEAAPADARGVIWLLVEDEEPAGVFLLHAHNAVCYEVHVCLLPRIWGSAALQAGNLCFAWAFENTPCQKLIANVPADNMVALKFAERCGFAREGINRRSFLKHGELLDQTLLGLSKSDWYARHGAGCAILGAMT